MAYGYPGDCTQLHHDRAFEEQGPLGDRDRDYDPNDEPRCPNCNHAAHDGEICGEPLRGGGYNTDTVCTCVPPAEQRRAVIITSATGPTKIHVRELISRRDARDIARVYMALEREVSRAHEEKRWEDARLLCRIIGGRFSEALGSICGELGS